MVGKKTQPGKAQGDTGQDGTDAAPGSSARSSTGGMAVLAEEPYGCVARSGDCRPHLTAMAGAARGSDGRGGDGPARSVQGVAGQGPGAELDRSGVERQSVARGDPGRLDGGRARPAHRLAAPPCRPWSRADGDGRPEHADGEVRGRGLERCRTRWWGMASATAQPGQGARRQAVRGPGMACQSGLPYAQGPVPAGLGLPPEGERGRGSRARRARAAALSSRAVRQRDQPDAAALVQSGGAAPGDGDGRRQHRRRGAQPPARPQGGSPHHGRRPRRSRRGATSPSRRARWSTAIG